MKVAKLATAAALAVTCFEGLAQADAPSTFFTPTFDSAPAIVGATPSLDGTTVLFARHQNGLAVLSRPSSATYWYVASTDIFLTNGVFIDSDPAAVYLSTGTPTSGSNIMVAYHDSASGLMYAGIGHIQAEPLLTPPGASFQRNWSPAMSPVSTKPFSAGSSPALVRLQTFPTGAWYTAILARGPDNQIWSSTKLDSSNPSGCCWSNWVALPTLSGGFSTAPTVISPGETHLMMVCAESATNNQYQCATQQFGNGGAIVWSAWAPVPNFSGSAVKPTRPALARSNTATYLFATYPDFTNANESVSWLPNSGGPWSTVTTVGNGTGFILGPGALANATSSSVLSMAPGGDRSLWWNVGSSTGWTASWTQVQAYVGYVLNYYYSAAYSFEFGSSRGYTGDGNWAAAGANIGECGSSEWGMGVSARADGTDSPASLLCTKHSWSFSNTYVSDQHTLSFSGGDVGLGNHPMSPPDWDAGFVKAECATNEAVTGLAQLNGGLNAARCSAIGKPGTTSANLGTNCRPVVFGAGDNRETPNYPSDWASGYYKGECRQGSAVAGVSRSPLNGGVHAILCCNFGVL